MRFVLLAALAAAAAATDAHHDLQEAVQQVKVREAKMIADLAAMTARAEQAEADAQHLRSQLEKCTAAAASAATSTAQPSAPTDPPTSRKLTAEEMGWDKPEHVPSGAARPPGAPPPVFKLAQGGDDVGHRTRAALGAVENAQPGTPPTLEELEALEKAALDRQQYMCDTWPDNDDCSLLKGGAGPQSKPFTPPPQATADPFERALAWKLAIRDEDVLFRVLGSSTSAGHGAFFNSTYAVTTMRMLRPVFATIGLEWETRNQAMGGWDYRPGTIWCLPQIAGSEVDLVTHEWGMFGPEVCTVETYTRNFFATRRRPQVIYVGISGPAFQKFGGLLYFAACKTNNPPDWGKATCEQFLQKTPAVDPGGSGSGKVHIPCGGDADWEAFIKDAKCLSDYSVASGGLPESDPLFTNLSDLYFTTFNKTRPDSKEPVLPPPNPMFTELMAHYGKGGLGAYALDTSTASTRDHGAWWNFRFKMLRAGHHAGSFGHVLGGHIMSYWVLDRLLAAIQKVREGVQQSGSPAALAEKYKAERDAYRSQPLPDPLYCSKPGLEVDNAKRHKCYTNFLPRLDAASSIGSIVGTPGRWSINSIGAHQKDDGRAYRDHKLVVESKGSPEWITLNMDAPQGSPTGNVEVGVCLYWWLHEQAGEAKCGTKHVRLHGITDGRCGESQVKKHPEPIAPFISYRSTGKPFTAEKNVDAAPAAGASALPDRTNARRNPCFSICTVPAGTKVELSLRAEPGCQLSLSHVFMVDADSSTPV